MSVPRPTVRPWWRLVAAVAVLATLLAVGTARARAEAVDVRVELGKPGTPMPAGFTGLSFELGDLPQVARDGGQGSLVALLRAIGPGVLRFGGSTADHGTVFSTGGALPPWTTTRILPGHFDLLRALLRRSGWRAVLTADLLHRDPQGAARMLAEAERRLGPRLVGYEIGNEADAFPVAAERPPGWGYLGYRAEVRAYRRAIDAAVPGLPLLGPDTTNSWDLEWLERFARDERPSVLTPHFYPLDDCFRPAPDVTELLGRPVRAAQERALHAMAVVGRAARLPVRVGETNNVGCAGTPGVSDAHGSALWTVRYVLAVLRARLAGVDLHTLPDRCGSYTSVCAPTPADVAAGRLRAQPAYYGLLLLRRLVGLELVRVTSDPLPDGTTVDALADRARRRAEVVVVNSARAGTRATTLRLHVGDGSRTASVLRLTGRGLRATSGTRLGDRVVTPAGRWRPAAPDRVALSASGAARVTVPAGTAALVTLQR